MSDPSSSNLRQLTWVVLLCSAALLAPIALPLFIGRVFVYNDLSAFHLPLRYLYQQALAAGDTVLWTPSILAGFYIHGEGQIGLLHPFHQVLYRLFPLWFAFDLEIVANYVLAFAGMYWLLRRLSLERVGSLLGAMLFAFGGFNLLHHIHVNVIAIVAHVPWLLASADVVLVSTNRRERAAGFAGVALTLASELLLGFPQGVWWNALALGGFVAYRLRGSPSWRPLATLAGAGVSGCLMGAVQVLPTLDVSAKSIRPLMPPDFSLTFSLHPWNFLQLWSPYIFIRRVYSATDTEWPHEFGIYTCALMLVALPWLWIRRDALRPRRGLIVAAAIFAAATMVLALGRYGGIGILFTQVPVLQSFRAPARYIVLVQFALAILAAIAIEDLAAPRTPIRPLTFRDGFLLAIPALLSVATNLAAIAKPFPEDVVQHLSSPSRVAIGTALMLAVTAFFWLAARGRGWALPALVALTTIDVALWGVVPLYREPPRTIESLTAGVPAPPEPVGLRYAYVDDYYDVLGGNLLVLGGYRLASGYAALSIAPHFHLSSYVSQQLSGARWRFSGNGWKLPMEAPVDRARLLDQVVVTRHIARDAESVDLHHTALIRQAVAPLSGPPGTARVVVDRPGHIVVETSAPGRQLLSISERFHEGWRATAEGQRLETVAVHGDFLGCIVEAGTHRVELTFRPASFRNGLLLSLAGVAQLLLSIVMILRRSDKALELLGTSKVGERAKAEGWI